MAQGLRGPLTLIVAPAGFGKTTVVESSIADRGLHVAWLSLDQSDNQPEHFLIYLIAALQTSDRSVGAEAWQLMAGTQPARPEAVLTSLVNDLDRTAQEMVLELDDYQFIHGQEVHEAVTFLLEHCPRNFHVLIASRSDPPLPLARLRAREQLIELRASDLRFTVSEAAEFLNGLMNLRLDAESVAMLEERTEGWIAGLQMAALSMRDRKDPRGFIEGFSGTNRFILDYLLEEILTRQPGETQRFLLYTSILDRLTSPLCDAVLTSDETREHSDNDGEPQPVLSSDKQLEYLERENLFLISLDDEHIWFRYHHLFADLLEAHLQQTQPNLIPQLHIRASAWLEKNGYILEAIQHLFSAQEMKRASELIERYGPARWLENDLSVMQMADSLPREMLIDRPKLGLYNLWCGLYARGVWPWSLERPVWPQASDRSGVDILLGTIHRAGFLP